LWQPGKILFVTDIILKCFLAVFTFIIIIFNAPPAQAHFINVYCQSCSVNVNNEGINVYWTIYAGPIYAPIIWKEADVDNDTKVSREEALKWFEKNTADMLAVLDAKTKLNWHIDEMYWPSRIAACAGGEEDIYAKLTYAWPKNFSGAHTLILNNKYEENTCAAFFDAFNADASNHQDLDEFNYTVDNRGLAIDFQLKPKNDKAEEGGGGNDTISPILSPLKASTDATKKKNENNLNNDNGKKLPPVYAEGSTDTKTKNIDTEMGAKPETASEPQAVALEGNSASIDESKENKSAQPPNQVKILTGMISDNKNTIGFYVLIFLMALLLGALHALTPGHGKSIVAAYLVGSNGTVRHAIILGAIVSLTHTGTVIVLSMLALTASQFFVPQDIFPILEIFSGLLILILGIVIFRKRLHQWGNGGKHQQHTHSHHVGHAHVHHSHHHNHVHPHTHEEDPSKDVSMKSLLALGISGGMLPCPDAIAILLVAVALHKILMGIFLIVTFSLGLAAVLISIGIVIVRGRKLMATVEGFDTIAPVISVLSALVVLVLGVVLTYRAVESFDLLSKFFQFI
jgi:ABC-type nickel/cobalt efflux system permease component RcnA